MQPRVRYEEAGAASVLDGRYKLRREIARGGHGAVFEGEHLVTRRRVAVKMPAGAALGNDAMHMRLLREARVLAALWHPNLVAAHDAGVCSRHGPYLVLELIEGRSLDGVVIARQTLPVGQTVAIAIQLCAALQEAHAHGVIHRDIKPSNLLLTRGQRGDCVKLVDFGVAKLVTESESASDKLTKAGELVGTVEYVAPEQLMGTSPVDARADVYAVGVLMYECLTGEVPYAGGPTIVITSMLSGTKPQAICSRRTDVPPQLEAVIWRALEIDPSKRFASVQELAVASAAAIAGAVPELSLLEPTTGNPVEGPARRRQYARAPYMTPVRVLVGNRAIDGRTEDLSEGGVLMLTESIIDDGARVRLRLPLPLSGRIVELEADTRWVKARGHRRAIGAEFLGASEEMCAEIRSYVQLMTDQKKTPLSVRGP